ncbi:MAG: L-aspartate oxidase, partial [Frankiaceae bacterium]
MSGSTVRLPRRLLAPPAGWSVDADVIVVGSGIAGLTAALHVRRAGARVLVVTKDLLDAGSTRWAQGGIAAAVGPGDSPEEHMRDTLVAGAGLCDPQAVRALVTEGPGLVRELVDIGTAFDRDAQGDLVLTREGGHLRRRIAHAGGDATGVEIERALLAAVSADPGIEAIEHALVLDLLCGPAGQAAGVTLHVLGEGTRDGVGAATASAVVLASGGMGQIYSSTTNPQVATGDGVALAMRAGAEVTDLEFIQFHPTALWLGRASTGQQPLVSEAVRGEGATIVDGNGVRVMAGLHPLEDLAPRDVVAKAMARRMVEDGVDHLYLDARCLGDRFPRRFPTITSSCRAAGLDPSRQLIPVAPAAHYASGGVRTDLHGRTSLPGLYACGEVACTGVHGANRLASNSLLEGLVFGARLAADLSGRLPPRAPAASPREPTGLLASGVRAELAAAMSAGAGVLRSAESLADTAEELVRLGRRASADPSPETWTTTNLHTVASALVDA